MGARVKENEEAVVALKVEMKMLQTQVAELRATTEAMEAHLEDSEALYKRKNIRIIGAPEWAEGPTVDQFVEDLIRKQLQPLGLANYFSVERAHGVPGSPAKTKSPIIAHIFMYRNRGVILQTTRSAPPVK
ncbi:hypothetical protein NDU88_008665 [Pleurodeles waltl]|uniref:Uncharacterized protein n=1 Tax=Pleurodeles waltl TaxID=8319 RepID=A0AAV7QTF3_PLEWA|nr:hypothetical protein NDU88_008665 [Pleurodeles waltl]